MCYRACPASDLAVKFRPTFAASGESPMCFCLRLFSFRRGGSLLHFDWPAIAPRTPGSGELVAVNLKGNRARRALGIELQGDRIFFPGTAADREIAVRRTDHAGNGAF